jgi:hypothetical protein
MAKSVITEKYFIMAAYSISVILGLEPGIQPNHHVA